MVNIHTVSRSTVNFTMYCNYCNNLYISVSLLHEASSLEKNIFTATFSPCHTPRQTSPYRPLPMHSDSEICFASVRWISSGKPDPEPDVSECSRYSWKQIFNVFLNMDMSYNLNWCFSNFHQMWITTWVADAYMAH